MRRYLIFFVLVNLIVIFVEYGSCTLSKSDRKPRSEKKNIKGSQNEVKYLLGSQHLSLKNVTYREILKEHKSFSISQAISRNFDNEVLGYVTPWNNHGYNIAKLFAAKFTMISPVWLQLSPKMNTDEIVVKGTHDIDRDWMNAVKQINKKIKMVPRMIFESWTYQSLKKLVSSENAANKLADKLVKLAKDNGFDGFVIEMWRFFGSQINKELTQTLIHIATSLRHERLSFILVIPPPVHAGGHSGTFLQQDFERLVDHVTAFSLMTYDYSEPLRPGPNSPLPWLLKCVELLIPDNNNPNRKKLLLGLNFYGNDYSELSAKPIIGAEYISILEKFKPKFNFDNSTGEHHFTYQFKNSVHQVYYPTLYSIQLRIHLAKQLGISLSIWEIGQGLDYFYDVL